MLQEAECSVTSKDVFHISYDSDVEVVGATQTATSAEEDELGGAEVVPPLSTLNVPKITELLHKMDKPKNGKGVRIDD